MGHLGEDEVGWTILSRIESFDPFKRYTGRFSIFNMITFY